MRSESKLNEASKQLYEWIPICLRSPCPSPVVKDAEERTGYSNDPEIGVPAILRCEPKGSASSKHQKVVMNLPNMEALWRFSKAESLWLGPSSRNKRHKYVLEPSFNFLIMN